MKTDTPLIVGCLQLLISINVILGFSIPVPTTFSLARVTHRLAASLNVDDDDDDNRCDETPSSLMQHLTSLRKALEDDDNDDDGLDAETAKLSMLYTRIPNLALNKTFIGTSRIAGRGLFASVDCKRGDLLTCYPGDALVIIPDEEDWTILWGDHVPDRPELDDSHMGYMVHVNDDIGVLGLPELDHDPAYLGHFANDGAQIPLTLESLAPYVLESQKKANAQHKDLDASHMITVALRDIMAGEEILVSYGPDYWAVQPGFESDPSTSLTSKSSSSGSGNGFG